MMTRLAISHPAHGLDCHASASGATVTQRLLGAAAALLLMLLTPHMVVAHGASGAFLGAPDHRGDLHDLASGKPQRGPAYLDLTRLEVSIGADDLLVRFDIAGNVPAASGRLAFKAVRYQLLIDGDDDGALDYRVVIDRADGWQTRLWDQAARRVTALSAAQLLDDCARRRPSANDRLCSFPRILRGVGRSSILASVPLSLLGTPASMRFRGRVVAFGTADAPARAHRSIDLGDQVPDARGAWIALQPLNGVADLIPGPHPRIRLDQVMKDLTRMLGTTAGHAIFRSVISPRMIDRCPRIRPISTIFSRCDFYLWLPMAAYLNHPSVRHWAAVEHAYDWAFHTSASAPERAALPDHTAALFESLAHAPESFEMERRPWFEQPEHPWWEEG